MQLASRTCCLAFLLSVLLSGSSEAQIPGHPIAGYADRLSVQPGQVIRFMVSSEAPQYDAQLGRLIHGDTSPRGPGYREQELNGSFGGSYQGRLQPLENGSSAVVADHSVLGAARRIRPSAMNSNSSKPSFPLGNPRPQPRQ